MHAEHYEIPALAAEQLNAAKRRLAVGTTSVRALEHGIREGRRRFSSVERRHGSFYLPRLRVQGGGRIANQFSTCRVRLC